MPSSFDSLSLSFQTLLNDACYQGHLPRVQRLLSEGARLDWTGSSGKTPLHFAAMSGHDSICQLLLSVSPDLLFRADSASMTPLHLACRNDRRSTALLLVNHGAALDSRDDFGCLPEDWCRDGAFQDSLRRLRLASQDQLDPYGHDPYLIADPFSFPSGFLSSFGGIGSP